MITRNWCTVIAFSGFIETIFSSKLRIEIVFVKLIAKRTLADPFRKQDHNPNYVVITKLIINTADLSLPRNGQIFFNPLGTIRYSLSTFV